MQRFDRYGRTLAHVFLPSGKNLQAWMISRGYAIAFTTPPNDQMSFCYQQQEAKARKEKLGIWNMPSYQVKSTGQLDETSRGFTRLKGTVTRIRQNAGRVAIYLDNQLEINLYKTDLYNFNAYMLNNMQGKNIQIRGWLRQKKITDNSHDKHQNNTHYVMTLRHPDAIKVINSAKLNNGPNNERRR